MKSILSTLILFGLLVGQAFATLIVYEGFAPTPGPYNTLGNIATQNPGNSATSFGWSGAWKGQTLITVQQDGLSYSGFASTEEGRLFVPRFDNNGRWVMRQLDTGYDNSATETLYLSFLAQDVTQGGTEWGLELNNAGAGDRVHNSTRTLMVGMTSSGQLGMRTYGNGAGGTADAPLALGASTTNVELFVLKIELSATADSDTITIWRNPTDLTNEAANTAVGSLTGRNLVFDNIALNEFRNDDGVYFDEIRIGTTWDAVSPIPEPGTLLLVGIALGSLLLFRRRR